MTLPPDITERLAQEYVGADLAAAVALLQSAATENELIRPRVLRCVVHLAAGDLALLRHNTEAACRDYRDVIYWAEYDRDDRHVRDFNKPFEAS